MEENKTQSKTLVVNCATCDATQVKEGTLQAYDQVVINAATVLMSEESARLLHRYNVSLNAASTFTVPAGVQLITHNGSYTISGKQPPARPAALMINGSLTIERGSEAALERFAAISVNGTVRYPESIAAYAANIRVNGSTVCYPDDAILLKNTFTADKVFLLRAKEGGRYFASSRVVLTDCALDIGSLAAKGVTFLTRRAIVAEPLLEAAIPLFGDEVEIIPVPEGCVFVNDDLTLDGKCLRKYGGRLYVNGDLTLTEDSAGVLSEIEFLHVNGDVRLPAALAEAFEALDAHYDSLQVVRDTCICDRPMARVGRDALEHGDGLSVLACASVSLAEDIPAELIRARLDIRDCAVVKCTPEQRDAVEAVCTGVAAISDGTDEDGKGGSRKGLLKDALTGKKKVINAAEYQL